MAVLAFDNAPGAARTLLGAAALTGQTVTANQPLINVAQTWNNAGVVFNAVKVVATPTAAANGSLLLNLMSGGTTRLTVDIAGGLYNSSDAYHVGDVYLTTASSKLRMGTSGDARIGRGGSGAFTFDNNGSATFTVSAGSSGSANFGGPVRTISTTVGALPSPSVVGAGSRAYVTDASDNSFNAVLVGGGGHPVPVFSDGVAWRVG